jgi:hypothetical protein
MVLEKCIEGAEDNTMRQICFSSSGRWTWRRPRIGAVVQDPSVAVRSVGSRHQASITSIVNGIAGGVPVTLEMGARQDEYVFRGSSAATIS